MSASLQILDATRSNARPPVDVKPRSQASLGASWGVIAGLLAVAFLGGLALMQADWLRTGPANDFLSFYSAADASDIYAQSSIDAARPPAFAAVPGAARSTAYS